MPPSGLDELDAKAEQSRRRHRRPPEPKRPPSDTPASAEPPELPDTDVTGPEAAHEAAADISATPRSAVSAEVTVPKTPERRPVRRPAAAPADMAQAAAAVKVAQDHALAYGAVIRKQQERLELWLVAIKAARDAGAAPGLIRAGLEAAANRAGLPVEDMPRVVWAAAGLTPPN